MHVYLQEPQQSLSSNGGTSSGIPVAAERSLGRTDLSSIEVRQKSCDRRFDQTLSKWSSSSLAYRSILELVTVIMQYCLPKYSPLDSSSEIKPFLLRDMMQLLHCSNVKLNLRSHSKASLIDETSVQHSSQHQDASKEEYIRTSTPANNKIAPMVDSKVSPSKEHIF